MVHHRKVPRPGDLAFFDDTYDANHDGRTNDPLTHVAVVLSVAAWLAARTVGILPWKLGARPARVAAFGLAMGSVGIGGCVVALFAGGRLVPDGTTAHWGLLVGLAATALQVAGEEAFFRGWLLAALGRLARPSLAIAGSAILFSALHLVGGTRALLCLVNLVFAGVLFGLFAWRSGGLAMPFAAHVAWNAGETLVFGLYPNPGSGPWGAVWGHDIVGPALWGGGEEGLNDSVIVTLVLGALVLAEMGARRGQLA